MMYIWNKIFGISIHKKDKNKILTGEELNNPDDPIVWGLLYIYSMDTFIYKTLNSASRD